MWHRKLDREGKLVEGCGGRVFVDRAFSGDGYQELSCIECGKRWIIEVVNNALGRRVAQAERKFINAGNK